MTPKDPAPQRQLFQFSTYVPVRPGVRGGWHTPLKVQRDVVKAYKTRGKTGLTLQAIAATHHTTPSNVINIAKRHGVYVRVMNRGDWSACDAIDKAKDAVHFHLREMERHKAELHRLTGMRISA